MKTKRTQPIVSVIMPAHNAELFLVPAINSILAQTFTNFELILVNDGSRDQTGKIARRFAAEDTRVRVISYRQNKGESAAANVGYQASRGKYIARMDADDIAHPERLAKQVAFLNKHSDYVVVGSQALIIDENDQVIGHKLFPTTNAEIYKAYGILHPMLHPSIMVRRSALDQLPWSGRLWANQAEPNDDYFTLFYLLHCGKFANLPQKLMYYRMHENNKSMQQVKKKFINSLRIRIHAVRHLGYPLTTQMVINAVAQSALVLALPEWVVIGTFLWVKGMKPIEKAFPFIGKIQSWLTSQGPVVRWDYALPVLAAMLVQSLITRRES
jgi:glycosyltransferase involved in cell wall biosynthesis